MQGMKRDVKGDASNEMLAHAQPNLPKQRRRLLLPIFLPCRRLWLLLTLLLLSLLLLRLLQLERVPLPEPNVHIAKQLECAAAAAAAS